VTTDRITATTIVRVPPDVAFEVFTDEIDAWWRRGPRFRWLLDAEGRLRFEGGEGGRLVEVRDDATEEGFEVGRILVWKPAERLVFEMGARAFERGQTTEVEITFERVDGGTRVRVEHRGWEAIPADHPARHGLDDTAFVAVMGSWWGELLVAARAYSEERSP
jgi:uncharacterized protein YndB with AHSA1/START domain